MTDQDFIDAMKQLENIVSIKIEYRAYYNDDGSIITYSTEDIPGKYIVITAEQYSQARHDAKVIGGKLVFTHRRTHVYKLIKNKTQGVKTSKYDVNVITEDDDSIYYTMAAYELKR